MPKLRHIALHVDNPEEVAEFYKSVFDMVEVGRTDSVLADGIYLSDGDLNMAILKFKTDQAADRGDGMGPVMGLHHFGFLPYRGRRTAACLIAPCGSSRSGRDHPTARCREGPLRPARLLCIPSPEGQRFRWEPAFPEKA